MGISAGFAFALGCIVIEIVYVRITLVGMNWLQKREKLFKLLEWVSLTIIFGLAIFCFYSSYTKLDFSSAFPKIIKYPFFTGMVLSFLEPMKISFWFVWSTFLFTNKSLLPVSNYYNYFVVGVALGSLFGFMPFIYSGSYLIPAIKSHQPAINFVTGIILLLTAIIQLYRIFRKNKALIQHNQ